MQERAFIKKNKIFIKRKRRKKRRTPANSELRAFGLCGMFAMLGAGVERMLCDVAVWLEEVRQDVCNMQSDIVVLQREAQTMRGELDRLRAEVAQMQRKERFRELAAQEAKLVFSGAVDERRLFERKARVAE